jgi:hypothetical protein
MKKVVKSSAFYEGDLNSKGLKHGTGILTWDDGDQYVGKFENDEKLNGIFTWKNGDQYSGEFKNNLMHGKGTYICQDGRKYVGEWSCGYKEGKGVLTYTNGESYEGNFVRDNCQGIGCYKSTDGKIFKGHYSQSIKNGWGVIYWPNGSKTQGCWSKNHLNGPAIDTDEQGRRYEQMYSKDDRKGEPILLKRTEEKMISILKSYERPLWIPDNLSNKCYKCDVPFTLVNRRHHCRNCGFIFCGDCTTKKMRLSHSNLQVLRICDECYLSIPTFELTK